MRVGAFQALCIGVGLSVGLSACGSGAPSGTEAMRRGVGAACSTTAVCSEMGQVCLPFKGGYCGVENCTADAASCPAGSVCVQHTDGKAYCFLVCVDKIDCNVSRSPDVEANCSSNVTLVSGGKGKACVPPSG